MVFKKQTRLQILFWEIKTRFVYLIFSFFLSFAIAYSKAQALIYVFALHTITFSSLSCFHFYVSQAKLVEMLSTCIFVEGEDEQLVQLFENKFFPENKQLILENQIDSIESADPSQSATSLIETLFPKESQETKIRKPFDGSLLSLLLNISLFLNSLKLSSIDLIFTSVDEAFSIQVKLSFFLACFSIIFLLLYESYSFFAPSLYFYESKKWISRLVIIGLIWCCFQYSIFTLLIPKLVYFLLEFEITSSIFNLRAETKVSSYFSWASNILFVSNCVLFFAIVAFFWGTRKASISSPQAKLVMPSPMPFNVNKAVTNFLQSEALYRTTSPSCQCPYGATGTKPTGLWMGTPKEIAFEPSLTLRKKGKIIQSFSKHRKTSVIVMILVSALIAPPDVIQLFLLTLFLLLFELFLFCFALILHRVEKQVSS